jgi:LPS O-antigen subunit length determinant protein (WzzB/FepE family)
MQEKYLQEDEIDLRELFKTIWDKRFFIIIFTFIITLIS